MQSIIRRLPFLVVLSFMFFASAASAQTEPSTLDRGIEAFQRENNDEAVALLEKARQEDPSSTRAAFYLGAAYKRVQRYPDAEKNLNDAITMSPKVREALTELMEVQYHLGKYEDAKRTIATAGAEGIRPAQAAYF